MYISCIAVSLFYHSHSEWYLTNKTLENSTFSRVYVVRVAGLEPARPEWTLEPESLKAPVQTRSTVFMTLALTRKSLVHQGFRQLTTLSDKITKNQ